VGFFHYGDPTSATFDINELEHFVPGTTTPTTPASVDVSTIDTDSSGTITASEVLTHLQSQGIDTVDLYTTYQNISDGGGPWISNINLTPLSPTDTIDLSQLSTLYASVRDSAGEKVALNYLARIQLTGTLNQAPTTSPITLTSSEGETLDIDFDQYVTDPEGQPLSYQVISSDAGAPTISISGGMGTVVMPATTTTTDYQYTYQVTDSQGATATDTITITNTNVNNPSAIADLIQVAPNNTVNGNLLENDANASTIENFTNPAEGILNLNTADGSYTYTAGANTGTFSFSYTIENQFGEQDTATVNIEVDEVFSVFEVSLSKQLVIYPNPVKESFNISLYGNTISLDVLNIKVLDLTGRVVLENTTNVSELQAGLYLVKITYQNQTVVKRIVKE
jgi:hypothetical protein